MMMRQIHFASVDLELHSRFKPGSTETVFDADRRIAKSTQVGRPALQLFSNSLCPCCCRRICRCCKHLSSACRPEVSWRAGHDATA